MIAELSRGKVPGVLLRSTMLIGILACAETGNREADPHSPYAEGVALYRAGGEGNLRQAIERFSQAAEVDSTYAPAWAGLAKAYAAIGGNYNILSPEDSWPAARAAASNAVRLGDGLADAHLAQALVSEGADWDWTSAERSYQRALALEPDNVEALNAYAWFLYGLGRPVEAEASARKAAGLDPTSADLFILYLTAGDPAAQIDAAAAAIAADPTNPSGYWTSALIHTWEGEYERAVDMLQQQIPLMEGDVVDEVALLGFVYGRMGREQDARAMLGRLDEVAAEGRYVSPVLRAWVHSGLGETEEALDWLQAGYDARAHRLGLGIKGFSVIYDPIREDPRFRTMLQSLDLEG